MPLWVPGLQLPTVSNPYNDSNFRKMVSLITPSFNSAAYVEATYHSILRQTNPNWEWIIVDDGSSDHTLDLLGQYAASDSRIRFYKRANLPKGATTCRNEAVAVSRGEYLIFLDTDDILASFCIEQRLQGIIHNPEADFVVFQMLHFQERTDDLRLLWNMADSRDDLERAIRLNPVMAGSSTIWKKSSFIEIGLWDPKILINQDIELHIRAICKGCAYKLLLDLPPDLYVRNVPTSISRAKKKSQEKQRSRVYYYQQIADHIDQSGQTERYRAALNWLLLKLYFDLIFDREPEIAEQLWQNQPGITARLSGAYQWLHRLIRGSGNYGYFWVAMIRFLNRSFQKLNGNSGNTFAQHNYPGPVE